MYTYHDAFFGITVVALAILDLLLLGPIGGYLLYHFIRERRKPTFQAFPLISRTESSLEFSSEEEFEQPKPVHTHKRWWRFLYWLSVYNVAHIGFCAVAFDYLPIGVGIPLLMIFLCVSWIILLPMNNQPHVQAALEIADEQKQQIHPIKTFIHRLRLKMVRRKYLFFGGLIYLILMVVGVCILIEGLCITAEPITMSTKFTRSFQESTCDTLTPCHTYLTVAENPSTSIFVNFHTKHSSLDDSLRPKVYYDTRSYLGQALSSYQFEAFGGSDIAPLRDHDRAIHYVRLSGLSPNTTYYFRAGYSNSEVEFSVEKSFRTSPAEGTFTFIVGGDMGVNGESQRMSIWAASQSPHFAMVGGDISYANGMNSCYRRWDYWLKEWEDFMVDKLGHSIPMLLSIGNHEGGGFGVGSKNVPFYTRFFPFEGDGSLSSRNTYHSHFLGNHTMILSLDSGVIIEPDDEKQIAWMDKHFNDFSSVRNKLALYHVPLYPSVRSYDNENSKAVRRAWLDIFDSYGLSIGFENHDHLYKRTKRLFHGEVSERIGTVYMGDGCWGATPRVLLQSADWYLDRAEATNFVMKVVVGNNILNVTSVDIHGNIIDSYQL